MTGEAAHIPLTLAAEFDSRDVLLVVLLGLVPVVGMIAVLYGCYRRCPVNKIIVVYGKVGGGKLFRCVVGGGTFIWPLIQDYGVLSRDPIRVQMEFDDLITQDGAAMKFKAEMTCQITTDPRTLDLAAQHLIGLSEEQLKDVVHNLAMGEVAKAGAGVSAEYVQSNRHGFMNRLNEGLSAEFEKIGIELSRLTLSGFEFRLNGVPGHS